MFVAPLLYRCFIVGRDRGLAFSKIAGLVDAVILGDPKQCCSGWAGGGVARAVELKLD